MIETKSSREQWLRSGDEADALLLKKTYSAIQWRILPILFCLWLLAWVDRSNVAFAKVQMVDDLKFSETVYGVGAGLFFLAYVIFGIPSSILQKQFGPRRLLSGLAVCWGLTSVAMMFVHTASEFYVLRLLLGMFEAGFYPGVVLYFNAWFAGRRRARNFSMFHSGATCSPLVVGLTGGFVLAHMNGLAGFEGWRWMFLAQAVPTVLLALVAYFILPDRPDTARWLTARQKSLINEDLRNTPELVAEAKLDATAQAHGAAPIAAAFDSTVWVLAAMYFCIMSATTALVFFVPTIIREAGVASYGDLGLAVAGASFFGALGNILISTLGGDAKYRRAACTFAGVLTAACMVAVTLVWHTSPLATSVLLAFGLAGSGAGVTLFWQLVVGLLDRRIMIIGVPLISSIANLAGFMTPAAIGYLRDMTGSYLSGFMLAAAVQAIGALIIVFGSRYIIRKRTRAHTIALDGAV